MRAGKEAEFSDFIGAASPRLLALAWLLTRDRTRSEDLVQETLTRMYPVWWRIRTEHATAYARRVLMNLHHETWRKHGREVLHEQVPERPTHPQRQVEPGAHVDLVDALQQLPARERQAVVLRHYADLSERETAESMKCSIGTVKSSTSRGLSRLRTLLDVEAEEGDSHAHL